MRTGASLVRRRHFRAAGEQFLGDRHCERGARRATDDAELTAGLGETVQLGVIAGPGGIGRRPALRSQPAHQIAVGIERAYG